MKFNELGLSEKVLNAVEAAGYDTPTPIQAQAIPEALQGRDVLGIAQTGTGKTAAFTLPMLCLLERGRAKARMPRTLILEPTRELAAQVEEAFTKYGVNHKLNLALLIGGVSDGEQKTKIDRGADVVIATPGRLLDLTERGGLLLTGIEILVIDEADRMLDIGWNPDIERICKLVSLARRAVLLGHHAAGNHPPHRNVPAQSCACRGLPLGDHRRKHHPDAGALRRVAAGQAGDASAHHPRGEKFKNAIIFCNRKRDVQVVYRWLEKRAGFSVGALHGDLDQRARMAALDAFRSGQVQLIVCSDVAARGLDIPDVSHVINYDAPHHSEDYVHRIGRTGRAGKTGHALTIVTRSDAKAIAEIEKLIARKIEWQPGAEMPTDDERGSDERHRRERGGRRGERSGQAERSGHAERRRTSSGAEQPGRKRSGGSQRGAPRGRASPRSRRPNRATIAPNARRRSARAPKRSAFAVSRRIRRSARRRGAIAPAVMTTRQ